MDEEEIRATLNEIERMDELLQTEPGDKMLRIWPDMYGREVDETEADYDEIVYSNALYYFAPVSKPHLTHAVIEP